MPPNATIRELQLEQPVKIPTRSRKVVKAVITASLEPCSPESLDSLLFIPIWMQEGELRQTLCYPLKESNM